MPWIVYANRGGLKVLSSPFSTGARKKGIILLLVRFSLLFLLSLAVR